MKAIVRMAAGDRDFEFNYPSVSLSMEGGHLFVWRAPNGEDAIAFIAAPGTWLSASVIGGDETVGLSRDDEQEAAKVEFFEQMEAEGRLEVLTPEQLADRMAKRKRQN